LRLTSFTDFGLRALMCLAGAPGKTFTTSRLSEDLGVSRHHLTKVVQNLANVGLLDSKRGAGGGVQLARPAESIRLGDVIRHLEQRQPLVDCFREDGGDCALKPECRLKGRLASAREAFYNELNKSTLADCALPRTADLSEAQ